VSSVREVVGAEGPMVVSNEIFAPDVDRRAVPSAPIRSSTMVDLEEVGFDKTVLLRPEGWW
jgi:pilus assembly protein CpaF